MWWRETRLSIKPPLSSMLTASSESTSSRHSPIIAADTEISRCYTSLAQANDRLGLLSRSNANTAIFETLRAGEDKDTGCQWCTWTRPDANVEGGSFRFYAEVKRVVMQGRIRSDGPSEQEVLTAEDLKAIDDAMVEHPIAGDRYFGNDEAAHLWG